MLVDRLPKEPTLWYQRFQVYCELGAERTLFATIETIQNNKDANARTYKNVPMCWQNAFETWHWEARAEAWDAANRQQERNQIEEARLLAIQNQTRLMNAIQTKIAAALQSLPADQMKWTDLNGAMRLLNGGLWDHYQHASRHFSNWKHLLTQQEQPSQEKEEVLRAVVEAGVTDWRASAWLLERRFWRDFAGRKADVIAPNELTELLQSTIHILLEEIPAEYHPAIQQRLEELLESKAEQRTAFNESTDSESSDLSAADDPFQFSTNLLQEESAPKAASESDFE